MITLENVSRPAQPRTRRRSSGSRPMLCFVYSPTSGPSRRAEGFLAQVLQRRQNHRAFVLHRIDCVERPELAGKLGTTTVPALVVVERRRVRARLEGLSGCREIEEFLEPWLAPPETEAVDSRSESAIGGTA
jgi:thioredoxin-like negative regulator of GroEL